MGLDGIELVLALEEAFGVELEAEEVVHAVTPRLVGDLIFSKLQATDQTVCQSQRAFYVLRKAFMGQFGLQRAAVTPDMSFRELIPPEKEEDAWNDLKRSARARSWPALARPQWLRWSIRGVILGAFATVFFLLWKAFPIGATNAAVVGAVPATVVGLLCTVATRKFKTRIPPRFRRIRDLVPFAVTSDEVKWTRDQVSALVKQVVLKQLAIPEAKYREDANFVKDLGLDQ